MTTLVRKVTAAEKAIGKRLKQFRVARKRSQQWLADELGKKLNDQFYQSTVADWESGKLRLHGHLIVEICKLLKVEDPSELLCIKSGSPLLDNPDILKRLNKINKLKKKDQENLIELLSIFLKQK